MVECHEECHGGGMKKHLIKGSKEAKEYMARIRAMKGTSCKGDGILRDIKQGLTKVAKAGLKPNVLIPLATGNEVFLIRVRVSLHDHEIKQYMCKRQVRGVILLPYR